MYKSIYILIFSLILFLISVSFVTLLERKIIGLVGLRFGPMKVSILGFMQAMGDACKLMSKQINLLTSFNVFFYYFSTFIMLISAMMLWMIFLSDPSFIEIKISILLIMIILMFNSLNSILAGWSTFSKYSLIGSIRTVSQLISYESALYFCLLFLCYLINSFCLSEIFFFPLKNLGVFIPTIFFFWILSILAELNRTPFDFSEGESELVSGFNTEFGSSSFTFLFLAEYSNILFMSFLSMFIFFPLQSWLSYLFLLLIIWVRCVCPRFRFDKLMNFAWKFLLPFLAMMFLCFILFLF